MADSFSITKSNNNPVNTNTSNNLNNAINNSQQYYNADTVEILDVENSNSSVSQSHEIGFSDRVAATVAVGTTKVAEGLVKTGEKVVDGLANLDADVVGGVTSHLGDALTYINPSAGDYVKNAGEQYVRDMHDFIAYDIADTVDEGINNSRTMNVINDISYMKYDSRAAELITDFSNTASEIVLATALMIYSGGLASGTASSFIVGSISGYGEAGENYYKIQQETNAKQKAGMVIGAVAGGLKFIAYGRLGIELQGFGQGATTVNNAVAAEGTTFLQSVRTAVANLRRISRQGWADILTAAGRSNIFGYAIADVGHDITETVSSGMMEDQTFEIIARETGASAIKSIAINTAIGGISALAGALRFGMLYKAKVSEKGILSLTKQLTEVIDAAEDSGIFKKIYNAARAYN